MAHSRVVSRYAEALFQLAGERGSLKEMYSNAIALLNMCGNSREFLVFLKNPVIKGEKKKAVIEKIFENQFSTTFNDFIRLIITNKREIYLIEIVKSFIKIYKQSLNILDAEVVTAVSLNDQSKESMKAFIAKISGAENVELVNKIDTNIIGGFRLKFDDKLMDSSVVHDLEKIRKQIVK